MSLYSKYVEELTDQHILETEKGFLTYEYTSNNECWIRDIYVLPDFRDSGAASEMADLVAAVAKKRGCTHILGSVVPTNKGSTRSMKVLLSYGFEIDSSAQNFILLRKVICRP